MNQRRSPFLEQVRSAIRVRHYSYRTEQTYLFWLRRYILFHGKRHPSAMAETEVGKFLTHLAVDRGVSPSTQNQALNAIVFVYRHVIDRPLVDIHGVVRAKSHRKVPVVLTCEEVSRVLSNLTGVEWLPGFLLSARYRNDSATTMYGPRRSTPTSCSVEAAR